MYNPVHSFFDVARIIAEKQPEAFLLENVKNLVSHDKGNTFKVIIQTLRDEPGYEVHYKVIDGQHFVPQHRERILIVGFRGHTNFSWDALRLPEKGAIRLASVLHPQEGSEPPEEPFTLDPKAKVNNKYTLTSKLWAYLQAYAEKHRKAGNGFGFGLVDGDDIARTLSARYYKDGSEILISQGRKKRPGRLTPRECARLMGFPDEFVIPVSDTQACRQFGNSVVMPVIKEVARIMMPHVRMSRNLRLNPARADCGEKSSGSRHELQANSPLLRRFATWKRATWCRKMPCHDLIIGSLCIMWIHYAYQ